MKKLFLVFAKLLGLVQLYATTVAALQMFAMVAMVLRGAINPFTAAVSLGGLVLYTGVALAIAWVLLKRTEWLADLVGIRDDAPIEGLERVPALIVGIALIGVFVTVRALPNLVGTLIGLRDQWAMAPLRLVAKQMVPHLVQLALGLFLALKPAAIARRIAADPA
jgi:hypothetical protein